MGGTWSGEEMDEFERGMAVILSKNHQHFSIMARRGYEKHGRGAVFIWESEGKGALTTYRANFLAINDPAFHRSGPHPRVMTGEYDPSTEFVAIFVGTDETVHSVRVDLATEPFSGPVEV
jgi:hypothetical protein